MLAAVIIDEIGLMGSSLGGTFTVTSLSGWHDGADLRRERPYRAQQDGAWPSTGMRDGLAISVGGLARFSDPVVAKAAADTLRVMVGTGQATFTVVDSSGTRSTLVELDGRTGISWLNERLFAFSVPLFANSPVRYGPAVFDTAGLSGTAGTGWVWPAVFPVSWGVPAGVTPGAVTVENAGTASYWPRARIDGPVTNPVVEMPETGDWVKFTGFVASGQWLDLVFEDRRVLLNGQISVRQNVTSSGDWLAVPVGGASVAWTADDADPAALLSVWSCTGAWS